MEKIVIVGAGANAENVIALIHEENNYDIHGLLDIEKTGEVLGYPILGDDDLLPSLHKEGIKYAFPGAAIGDKTDTTIGQRILEKIIEANFEIPNLISSKAIIRENVQLGKGILIQPSAVVDVSAQLGDGVVVNPQVLVGHDCKVGNSVVFAGGVTLNAYLNIGECALIGMGASVYADVGAYSKVAPGAVVTNPVPDNHIAYGNPANVMPQLV